MYLTQNEERQVSTAPWLVICLQNIKT